jgi:hypothetical protein
MQTQWDFDIAVGKGRVKGKVQLLRANFYSLIDNMISEQIITGDSRTLGMKVGRIKDALIWNGIVTTKENNKSRKVLRVTHPEINNGEETKFTLRSDEVLLNQPLAAEDGDWMSRLGDLVAGQVVERNPGLEAKYGTTIFGLFKQVDVSEGSEAQDSEEEEEAYDPEDAAEFVPDEEEDEKVEVPAGAANPT